MKLAGSLASQHASLPCCLVLLLLVLEHHVVVRLQSDAGAEDVDDALPLLGERVHHGGSARHLGGLEQIAGEFSALEAAISEERKAWQDETEKLAQRNERLASPWSIGFFGGYDPFRGEAVCGVGVTYSVVRF